MLSSFCRFHLDYCYPDEEYPPIKKNGIEVIGEITDSEGYMLVEIVEREVLC